ncbi:hypothetical protein Q5752_003993 [Cryptotrichosporon argae]
MRDFAVPENKASITTIPLATTPVPRPAMCPLRPQEQQWLFTPDELAHTPSRGDGFALADELARRKTAIDLVRSLWLRVNGTDPPPLKTAAAKGVITVAAVLIHRFYMRRSLADFPEELIATTMLFLASKIEEEPLRVRHIINHALDKFEPGAPMWMPSPDQNVPAPLEYQRWERDVLAAEEAALEALCFDMSIEQPWTALRRAVRGMDRWWLDPLEAGGSGSVSGGGTDAAGVKGKARATERNVLEGGWALLNETLNAPLAILHPAPVLALVTYVLVVSILDRLPFPSELTAASDIAWKFDLNPSDMTAVRDCVDRILGYADQGLIDRTFLANVVTAPDEPYRRYRPREAILAADEAAAGSATPGASLGSRTPASALGTFAPRHLNGNGSVVGGLTPA